MTETSSTVSVCTLVRGRDSHLQKLVQGLNKQSEKPLELVICYMQDSPARNLPETDFPIVPVFVEGDKMPLAAARNRAASKAQGDVLIFLDVDCIPSTNLVEKFHSFCAAQQQVALCEVFYLPASLNDADLDYKAMDKCGERHPAKPVLHDDEIRPETDHGELWGLAFALHRNLWGKVGGMNENYIGYGAEETDFAERLREHGIKLSWVGGLRAYHQHHQVNIPPYQHFDDIIRNATLFYRNWDKWCMEYWLEQFENAGLVKRDENQITVVRNPTSIELDKSRQPGTVLFS